MDRQDRSLVAWWVLLVLLTLISFESGFLGEGRAVSILAIVLALFKIRVVIVTFMEVGEAPAMLRIGLDVWLVGLGAVLIALWHGFGF